MKGVARKGDKISHGGEIITASGDIQSDGIAVARVGDTVNCKKHGIKKIVAGSSGVGSNDKRTARVGDKTSCGAEIITGSGQRLVGDDSGASITVDAVPESAAFTKPADKPLKMAPATETKNAIAHVAYLNNPQKSANPEAAANGVKENFPGTPDTTDQVDTEPPKKCTNGHDATVMAFLQKMLSESARGSWRESGQGGKPSNPNIIRIWTSLGYPSTGMWASDQTPWCAGFVNLALKECGLPYSKEAGARNTISKATALGYETVSVATMQPGDLVLWSFNHVNFCYTADAGKFSFVGGNQTPSDKSKTNNPSDGDVTISWKSGWTSAKGGIVSVVRPKCQ